MCDLRTEISLPHSNATVFIDITYQKSNTCAKTFRPKC